MSAVRMCDRCGNVFSERADGWTSMQAQRVTRKDGRQVVTMENLDACPPCSEGADDVTPRIAVASKSHTATTRVDSLNVDAESVEG